MKTTGQTFIEMTKYINMSESDQTRGIVQPPVELPVPDGMKRIELPDPRRFVPAQTDLTKLIEQRLSVREYQDESISLDELSYLLWSSHGIKQSHPKYTLRTVPSAGARHAIETFLLINRVDRVQPGLYRYIAGSHELGLVGAKPDTARQLTDACLGQHMILDCAVTFIWMAIPYRMTWRYGERGYRYLHLDAGHICQNLYLAAESTGCGACAIAAFDDDAVDRIIGADGDTMFTLYLAALGRKLTA